MTPLWIDRPPTWQPTPDDYYAETSAIGSGALGRFHKSPESFVRYMWKMAQAAAMGPRSDAEPPGAAMVLGAAVDCRLTESRREFERRFVVTDSKGLGVRGVMKIGTAAYSKALRLVAAVKNDPRAAKFLARPALRQMSHKWNVGGLTYRERIDYLTDTVDGVPIVVDLKVWGIDVTKDWQVRQHADRMGAFRQLALYGQGIEDLWNVFPHLVLIIVSSKTEEPHVRVDELQGDLLERSIAEVDACQVGLTECFRTGNFNTDQQQEIGSFGA